jgi:hypothetical protein
MQSGNPQETSGTATLPLEERIRRLRAIFDDFYENLKLACDYVTSDAQSSLTKSRLIMEAVLVQVYQVEMDREPKKPLLGDMLNDNQFTRKLGRRIVVRMNTVREMGNLGAHGLTVAPDDAARALEDLCTVLEWYTARYLNRAQAASSAVLPTTNASRPATSPSAVASSVGAEDHGTAGSIVPTHAVLSFCAKPGEETRVIVEQNHSAVAGRLTDLAIVFDHATVSKRHAEFQLGAEGLSVSDLDSKNHVFVNGEPVTWILLNKGDTVRLSASGPIIKVVDAPFVWPQTVSDLARLKPSPAPSPAAQLANPLPGTPIADPTEVEQSPRRTS